MRINTSHSGRGAALIGFVLASVLKAALAAPPTTKYEEPTKLAEIAVPHPLSCLSLSSDNVYLAAGSWGWLPVGTPQTTSEILIVDLARASIKTTLKVTAVVSALSFSPDGKWLVVATAPNSYAGNSTAELAVFDVSEFAKKFSAKPSQSNAGFTDVAWSVNGKLLCAIETSTDSKSRVRRWEMPAFTEQPSVAAANQAGIRSLAQSPDGKTLAVGGDDRVLRLFDLKSGTERNSFTTGLQLDRLGFTEDGKTIAVIDGDRLSWHEAENGKVTRPERARIVIQPAGLGDIFRSHHAVSLDGSKQISAGERHPTIMFQKFSKAEHGAYVHIQDSSSGKTWDWRVGETKGTTDTPVLAIYPDGTKLVGTVLRSRGNAIVVWSMPK